MDRLDRVTEAIRMGFLDPQAALLLPLDPVSLKRVKGLIRYEKRLRACKRPHNAAKTAPEAPANPRFLKHIAFTRVRP